MELAYKMGLVSVQTGAMRADHFQEKRPTFKVCFWCVNRGRGIVKRYIEADSGFAEGLSESKFAFNEKKPKKNKTT